MFGIKISCKSSCEFVRPMMQQIFCVTRVVILRDPCCGFTQPMLPTFAKWVGVWV